MEYLAKVQEETLTTIQGERGTGFARALSARPGRDTHPFNLIERNKSGTIGERSLAGHGYSKYRFDT